MLSEALGNASFQEFAGMTHFGPMENGAFVAASIAALFD